MAAIEKDNLPPIIQLGPDYCTSINELATILIEKIFKKNVGIVFDTSKPEGDLGRCADYSLAKKFLGWYPKISMEDGLRLTANWINNELDKMKNA
jgi:nucleoside-diphosphate-sugar epimerase